MNILVDIGGKSSAVLSSHPTSSSRRLLKAMVSSSSGSAADSKPRFVRRLGISTAIRAAFADPYSLALRGSSGGLIDAFSQSLDGWLSEGNRERGEPLIIGVSSDGDAISCLRPNEGLVELEEITLEVNFCRREPPYGDSL
jgi:hypothetical protein